MMSRPCHTPLGERRIARGERRLASAATLVPARVNCEATTIGSGPHPATTAVRPGEVRCALRIAWAPPANITPGRVCLLYTSDAADERSSVDLGGRRII